MNKYSIVISHTHGERSDDYLSDTVENLCRSGVFRSKLLASFSIFESNNRLHQNNNPENALKCLKEAYRNNTEWVIFMEHDIDVIDNFLESVDLWISEHHHKDVAFYPLCASYNELFDCKESAWEYPTHFYYGAQGYCISRENLSSLINYLENNHGPGYHDIRLQNWALEYAKDKSVKYLLTPSLSFVQHVGVVSTLHPGRFHDYPSWPGRQYTYPGKVVKELVA